MSQTSSRRDSTTFVTSERDTAEEGAERRGGGEGEEEEEEEEEGKAEGEGGRKQVS